MKKAIVTLSLLTCLATSAFAFRVQAWVYEIVSNGAGQPCYQIGWVLLETKEVKGSNPTEFLVAAGCTSSQPGCIGGKSCPFGKMTPQEAEDRYPGAGELIQREVERIVSEQKACLYSLSISPNPVQALARFRLSKASTQGLKVMVVAATTGTTVASLEMAAGETELSYDASHLPKGVYTVRFACSPGNYSTVGFLKE